MTLVIARKFAERIVVVSDTMISGEHLTQANIIPGRLKSIIVGDHLSISYSGFANAAITIIRKAHWLYREKKDLEKMLAYVTENTSDGKCEFIVVSHVGSPTIYRVSRGKCVAGADVYWLGNPDPIRRVREIESALPLRETPDEIFGNPEELRFSSALQKLYLDEGTQMDEGVGGFIVSHLCSPFGYSYQAHGGAIIRDTFQIPGGWSDKQLGQQASGMTKYSYNIVVSRYKGVAVIGGFLPEAKLGYLYSPIEADEARQIFPTSLSAMRRTVESCAQRLGGWIDPEERRLALSSSAST
jgi:hypothetical protein